ncbi:hypothetical protein SNEBB_003817 [Seison nebaliae]|nr:hypothetical protein SNEBB_003817 [Seison nebaliae]
MLKFTSNASDLRGCYTNVIKISDTINLHWKCFLVDRRKCDSHDSKIIMEVYGKCMEHSDLYTSITRLLYQKNFVWSLWVFYYEEPPVNFNELMIDLKEEENIILEHGQSYHVRMQMLKAFHGKIEQRLMLCGYIRLKNIFIIPSYQEQDEQSKSLSLQFNLFVHGTTNVCGEINIKKHETIICVNEHHVEYAFNAIKKPMVILSPFGIRAYLTGRWGLDERSVSMKIRIYWEMFARSHGDGDVSQMKFIEVIFGGRKCFYPKCLTFLTMRSVRQMQMDLFDQLNVIDLLSHSMFQDEFFMEKRKFFCFPNNNNNNNFYNKSYENENKNTINRLMKILEELKRKNDEKKWKNSKSILSIQSSKPLKRQRKMINSTDDNEIDSIHIYGGKRRRLIEDDSKINRYHHQNHLYDDPEYYRSQNNSNMNNNGNISSSTTNNNNNNNLNNNRWINACRLDEEDYPKELCRYLHHSNPSTTSVSTFTSYLFGKNNLKTSTNEKKNQDYQSILRYRHRLSFTLDAQLFYFLHLSDYGVSLIKNLINTSTTKNLSRIENKESLTNLIRRIDINKTDWYHLTSQLQPTIFHTSIICHNFNIWNLFHNKSESFIADNGTLINNTHNRSKKSHFISISQNKPKHKSHLGKHQVDVHANSQLISIPLQPIVLDQTSFNEYQQTKEVELNNYHLFTDLITTSIKFIQTPAATSKLSQNGCKCNLTTIGIMSEKNNSKQNDRQKSTKIFLRKQLRNSLYRKVKRSTRIFPELSSQNFYKIHRQVFYKTLINRFQSIWNLSNFPKEIHMDILPKYLRRRFLRFVKKRSDNLKSKRQISKNMNRISHKEKTEEKVNKSKILHNNERMRNSRSKITQRKCLIKSGGRKLNQNSMNCLTNYLNVDDNMKSDFKFLPNYDDTLSSNLVEEVNDVIMESNESNILEMDKLRKETKEKDKSIFQLIHSSPTTTTGMVLFSSSMNNQQIITTTTTTTLNGSLERNDENNSIRKKIPEMNQIMNLNEMERQPLSLMEDSILRNESIWKCDKMRCLASLMFDLCQSNMKRKSFNENIKFVCRLPLIWNTLSDDIRGEIEKKYTHHLFSSYECGDNWMNGMENRLENSISLLNDDKNEECYLGKYHSTTSIPSTIVNKSQLISSNLIVNSIGIDGNDELLSKDESKEESSTIIHLSDELFEDLNDGGAFNQFIQSTRYNSNLMILDQFDKKLDTNCDVNNIIDHCSEMVNEENKLERYVNKCCDQLSPTYEEKIKRLKESEGMMMVKNDLLNENVMKRLEDMKKKADIGREEKEKHIQLIESSNLKNKTKFENDRKNLMAYDETLKPNDEIEELTSSTLHKEMTVENCWTVGLKEFLRLNDNISDDTLKWLGTLVDIMNEGIAHMPTIDVCSFNTMLLDSHFNTFTDINFNDSALCACTRNQQCGFYCSEDNGIFSPSFYHTLENIELYHIINRLRQSNYYPLFNSFINFDNNFYQSNYQRQQTMEINNQSNDIYSINNNNNNQFINQQYSSNMMNNNNNNNMKHNNNGEEDDDDDDDDDDNDDDDDDDEEPKDYIRKNYDNYPSDRVFNTSKFYYKQLSNPDEYRCDCGFRMSVQRKLASNSGLFLEDEMTISGFAGNGLYDYQAQNSTDRFSLRFEELDGVSTDMRPSAVTSPFIDYLQNYFLSPYLLPSIRAAIFSDVFDDVKCNNTFFPSNTIPEFDEHYTCIHAKAYADRMSNIPHQNSMPDESTIFSVLSPEEKMEFENFCWNKYDINFALLLSEPDLFVGNDYRKFRELLRYPPINDINEKNGEKMNVHLTNDISSTNKDDMNETLQEKKKKKMKEENEYEIDENQRELLEKCLEKVYEMRAIPTNNWMDNDWFASEEKLNNSQDLFSAFSSIGRMLDVKKSINDHQSKNDPLTWETFCSMIFGQNEIVESVPGVQVGRKDEWKLVPPHETVFWSGNSFEPYMNKSNLIYAVIAPDNNHVITCAKSFFKELSEVYSNLCLGSHEPAFDNFSLFSYKYPESICDEQTENPNDELVDEQEKKILNPPSNDSGISLYGDIVRSQPTSPRPYPSFNEYGDYIGQTKNNIPMGYEGEDGTTNDDIPNQNTSVASSVSSNQPAPVSNSQSASDINNIPSISNNVSTATSIPISSANTIVMATNRNKNDQPLSSTSIPASQSSSIGTSNRRLNEHRFLRPTNDDIKSSDDYSEEILNQIQDCVQQIMNLFIENDVKLGEGNQNRQEASSSLSEKFTKHGQLLVDLWKSKLEASRGLTSIFLDDRQIGDRLNPNTNNVSLIRQHHLLTSNHRHMKQHLAKQQASFKYTSTTKCRETKSNGNTTPFCLTDKSIPTLLIYIIDSRANHGCSYQQNIESFYQLLLKIINFEELIPIPLKRYVRFEIIPLSDIEDSTQFVAEDKTLFPSVGTFGTKLSGSGIGGILPVGASTTINSMQKDISDKCVSLNRRSTSLAFRVYSRSRPLFIARAASKTLTALAPNLYNQMLIAPLTGTGTTDRHCASQNMCLNEEKMDHIRLSRHYKPLVILGEMQKSEYIDKQFYETNLELGKNSCGTKPLFVSYCISHNQQWLIATATDEKGEMLESQIIHIGLSTDIRSHFPTCVSVALRRLFTFIISIITRSILSWRIVIGKLGRMGPNELRVWSTLLKTKFIFDRNLDIKKQSRFNSNAIPKIVSAHLFTFYVNNSFQILIDCYEDEHRSHTTIPQLQSNSNITNNQNNQNKREDEGFISATHILTSPVDATNFDTVIRSKTGNKVDDDSFFSNEVGETENTERTESNDFVYSTKLGTDDIINTSLKKRLQNRRNDLFNWEQSDWMQSMRCDNLNDCLNRLNHEIDGDISNQPLAVGYYISSAKTGLLPQWLSQPNGNTFSSSFKASLLISNNYEELYQAEGKTKSNLHPLESNQTQDVLKYILKIYNALSWLIMDLDTHDRRSCLPIHVTSMLQIYFALKKFSKVNY